MGLLGIFVNQIICPQLIVLAIITITTWEGINSTFWALVVTVYVYQINFLVTKHTYLSHGAKLIQTCKFCIKEVSHYFNLRTAYILLKSEVYHILESGKTRSATNLLKIDVPS